MNEDNEASSAWRSRERCAGSVAVGAGRRAAERMTRRAGASDCPPTVPPTAPHPRLRTRMGWASWSWAGAARIREARASSGQGQTVGRWPDAAFPEVQGTTAIATEGDLCAGVPIPRIVRSLPEKSPEVAVTS